MRIQNLRIENFRNLGRFEMKDLGRINLIVGENNSGKTTILEAISILMARGNPSNLWAALDRRKEFTWFEFEEPAKFYEARDLFHGYEVEPGTGFRLSADTDTGPVRMAALVDNDPPSRDSKNGMSDPIFPGEFVPPWNLSLSWDNHGSREFAFAISPSGLVPVKSISLAMRDVSSNGVPLQLVSSSALTTDAAAVLFGNVVLTPEEDLVIDALKVVEPSIERIAYAATDRPPVGRILLHPGSIAVKLEGTRHRIPIGSLGEGVWRMLGLALNTIHSRDGILLVDDIDIGLHHTVMEGMWRFLDSAARRYNVQVFATTHSHDGYQSLAAICDDPDSRDGDVTIQRIEPGREDAVAYSARLIIAAARRDIEVR
jgi:energy-coupling factor transporter ATP-binding protein EcfA2